MECINIEKKSMRKPFRLCAVPGCTSRSTDAEISMHHIPDSGKVMVTITDHFGNKLSIDKRDAWMRAVKLETTLKNDSICNRHFRDEDYCLPAEYAITRKLRRTAVPSLNLPGKSVSSETMELNKKRRRRCEEREEKKKQRKKESRLNINKSKESSLPVIQEPSEQYIIIPNQVGMVKEIIEADICASEEKECKFLELIQTETKLSTATSIENFKLLETIINCYKQVVGDKF